MIKLFIVPIGILLFTAGAYIWWLIYDKMNKL